MTATPATPATAMPETTALPRLRLFIDNAWREGADGAWRDVVNPATGQPIAHLAVAAPADLDDALASAARGFAAWRQTSVMQRSAVLREAARLLRARLEDVATRMTREMGKPIGEARIEAQMCVDTFEWFAEEARRSYGREIAPRQSGVVQRALREPIGPVAAFTPWNFPGNQAAKKIAPAIAAGCSIIVKGPEEAPGAAIALAEVLKEAGLPAGVLTLVFGHPPQISEHLILSPVIRKVSFTGSVPVGKHLAALAARYVKPCTLELGGHAPVVIFDDAPLDEVVPKIVAGKFRNAGQVCISPTRFFVQKSVYDRALDAFAASAGALKVGDGLDPASQMGPLATARRREGVEALIGDAVASGATCLAGGERLGNSGFFHAPTVLADVPRAARILHEEPFGPVALFLPFADEDDALAQANDTPFGLAAYGFTSSARRAELLGRGLEAGMVSVNHFGLGLPETPFGGVKESGYGREGGPEGLDAYLVTKFFTTLLPAA